MACAQTLVQGLLDPCHWATAAPKFTVVAGETLAGVSITMARGAVLSIQVSDPQGLLTPTTGPIDFACQFHIVTAKGLHYNANIQSSSAGSRAHAITVPFGSSLSLAVLSPHLLLTDQTGTTVSAAATAISIPAGAAPAALLYTVTGTK